MTSAPIGMAAHSVNVDRYLTATLPKDGNDVARAKELLGLGYPALAPVLPHLFRDGGRSLQTGRRFPYSLSSSGTL